MPDALTQTDIDSLLRGAAPADGPRERAAEIVPYNFLRPPRISKDRRGMLLAIYGRFAMALQTLLSTRLRVPTDVSVGSVEQATFGEFILSLGTPCAAFVFDLGESIGVQGVMDLGTDLSYLLIDRMFGGPGESRDVSRPLTQLERMVVKGVVDRTIGFFGEVWEDHLPMKPVQVGFESTPETLQIAAREDNVLVANIDVRAGSFSGLVTICIPLIALEPFLQEKRTPIVRPVRGAEQERSATRAGIEQIVRTAQLPVTARFPTFMLRARDVAALKVGQVIHTGFPLDVPLEIAINGRHRFLGLPGQVRRTLGVSITAVCQPGQPDTANRAARAKVV